MLSSWHAEKGENDESNVHFYKLLLSAALFNCSSLALEFWRSFHRVDEFNEYKSEDFCSLWDLPEEKMRKRGEAPLLILHRDDKAFNKQK
jgi:hypothetical protein